MDFGSRQAVYESCAASVCFSLLSGVLEEHVLIDHVGD